MIIDMYYKEKITIDFKNGNYQSVIDVLKQNMENNIDLLVSTIELIYVHWYIALEVHEYPCCGMTSKECCDELLRVYNTHSPQWLNNADFLFYTAYMGSCFCEVFIRLHEQDVYDMFGKAYEMYPDNILYRWGNFNRKEREYRKQGKELEWKEENRRMARLVLANDECVKSIKKYPLLGEDLLWLLDIYQKEEF